MYVTRDLRVFSVIAPAVNREVTWGVYEVDADNYSDPDYNSKSIGS